MRSMLAFCLCVAMSFGTARADDEVPLVSDAQSAVLDGGVLKVRTVPIPGHFDRHARIVRVDGVNLGTGLFKSNHPLSVRLTPGTHDIQLIYGDNNAGALANFVLDAQAGKSYRVQLDWIDFEVREWHIVDAATGEPVGQLAKGDAYDAVVAKARTDFPKPPPGAANLAWDPLSSAFGSGKKPRVSVERLDGTKQYLPGAIIYNLPIGKGEHKVLLSYTVMGSPMVAEVVFVAKPDTTYTVKAALDGATTHFRIEDVANGEAVAEATSSWPRLYAPAASALLIEIPADMKICPAGVKCEAPAPAAQP